MFQHRKLYFPSNHWMDLDEGTKLKQIRSINVRRPLHTTSMEDHLKKFEKFDKKLKKNTLNWQIVKLVGKI
jgi:hypothetical protein